MICIKCSKDYQTPNMFDLCIDCVDELLNEDNQHNNDQFLEDLWDAYMEDPNLQ